MATTAICSVANCSVHSIFLISVSGKKNLFSQFKPTKVYFFKLKSKCVNPLPDNFAAQAGHCVFGSIAYTARC